MEPARRARARAGHALAALPLPVRFAVIGAALLGVVGGVVGLVAGVVSYPATAWFAVLELGVPTAALGAVLGLLAGSAAHLVRRVRSPSHVS